MSTFFLRKLYSIHLLFLKVVSSYLLFAHSATVVCIFLSLIPIFFPIIGSLQAFLVISYLYLYYVLHLLHVEAYKHSNEASLLKINKIAQKIKRVMKISLFTICLALACYILFRTYSFYYHINTIKTRLKPLQEQLKEKN